MSKTIWLSEVYFSHDAARPFLDTKPEEPTERDDVKVALNVRAARSWKVKIGERFAPEDLPKKFYKGIGEDDRRDPKRHHSLPAAFRAQYIFVDETIAAVMRQFNLGEHALHPVELYLYDCFTHIAKQYYILAFGVQKRTIDRQRSEKIKKPYDSLEEYTLPTSLTLPGPNPPPKLFYLPAALEGPDLWVDPEFPGYFFLSEDFKVALEQAGLAELMRVYPLAS